MKRGDNAPIGPLADTEVRRMTSRGQYFRERGLPNLLKLCAPKSPSRSPLSASPGSGAKSRPDLDILILDLQRRYEICEGTQPALSHLFGGI